MLSATTQMEIYTEILPESPDEEKTLKRCRPGERLTLCWLPDDKTSEGAVGVKRLSGETIGCLERGICEKISPMLGEGEVGAIVLLTTGGGFFSKQQRRCYIKITA